MEQFVADNERLRKKVSELGERMEFYKEKLLKYRNLYFQVVGQDPNARPSVNNDDVPREHQPAFKPVTQSIIQERPPSGKIHLNLFNKLYSPINCCMLLRFGATHCLFWTPFRSSVPRRWSEGESILCSAFI